MFLNIDAYSNKEVSFRYRGRSYVFSLSHGLFSSAGIDTGSAFLLKVFSRYLDNYHKIPHAKTQRRKDAIGGTDSSLHSSVPLCEKFHDFKILDAGCGTGVLGICTAGALMDLAACGADGVSSVNKATPAAGERASADAPTPVHCRAQDRDELARLFTEHNARRNGLSEENLAAYTEPLLAGPGRWDFIFTNIPAKAGEPVLEDFIRRSSCLLEKNGRVFLVAVNTLADFFRSNINAHASLLLEETGKEHTVFVYATGGNSAKNSCQDARSAAQRGNECLENLPVIINEKFPENHPFYIRNRGAYEMERFPYRLDTVYGAPGFDSPGGAVETAAKLAVKIDLAAKLIKKELAETAHSHHDEPINILVYDDTGQGHFTLWLANYLPASLSLRWTLSGRNILALTAARHALTGLDTETGAIEIVTAAGIFHARELHKNADNVAYDLIAYFPETVPETKREEASWEALSLLAAPGAVVLTGMNSMEADRFDKRKPKGFSRTGDIKRAGFRSMAYNRV